MKRNPLYSRSEHRPARIHLGKARVYTREGGVQPARGGVKSAVYGFSPVPSVRAHAGGRAARWRRPHFASLASAPGRSYISAASSFSLSLLHTLLFASPYDTRTSRAARSHGFPFSRTRQARSVDVHAYISIK